VTALDPKAAAEREHRLGLERLAAGDLMGAAEALARAAAAAPGDPAPLADLGSVLRRLGRLTDAERTLRRAMALDPKRAATFDAMATMFLEAGQFVQAGQAARRATLLAPGEPAFRTTLALVLFASGDREAAIRVLEDAVAATAEPPAILLSVLGSLRAAAGDPQGAIDIFERLLDRDPDDTAVRSARESAFERLRRDTLGDNPEGEALARTATEHHVMQDGHGVYWFNARSPTSEKPRFLVLTTGNCGAIWFTSALNIHPGLLTNCGIDHPIEAFFNFPLKKDGVHFLRHSGPEHFRHGVTPGFRRTLLEVHGIRYPIGHRLYHRLPSYVFDEMESLPFAVDHAAIGSVHAFGPLEFLGYYARDRGILGGRRVVVANMIRHPLARVESFMKALVHYELERIRPRVLDFVSRNPEDFRALRRAFGIDLHDPRVVATLFTFRIIRNVSWLARETRTFSGMRALRMEDLQEDRDYFRSAFAYLTSGRVVADDAYLDEVFKPANLGLGRRGAIAQGTRPPSPRDQWEAWSDFERAEFLRCCREDGIPDIYTPHGYDFSYVR
jgi:Flp pilus assembly protein TadD